MSSGSKAGPVQQAVEVTLGFLILLTTAGLLALFLGAFCGLTWAVAQAVSGALGW